MTKRRTTATGKSLSDEKGFALIIVLVFMILGALIIPPLLAFMGTGLRVNDIYETRTNELFAADAGVKEAIWNMQQGNQLPDLGNTLDLTLLTDNPNGKTRTVTVFCSKQDINTGTGWHVTIGGSYRITSTATSADGSSTTIEAWVDTLPFLFNYAITSVNDINLQPGTLVDGDVAGNVTGSGTVTGEISPPWDPDRWPFGIDLADHYWQTSGDGLLPPLGNSINVATTEYIGPGYEDSNAEIYSSVDGALTTLTGSLYYKGDLDIGKVQQDFALDLGGKTIFVEGNIFIGVKTTITGSGCIIAEGDVNFQPNITSGQDDFLFVMSVNGITNFQPSGDYYGSVAGNIEVNVQPGYTLIYSYPKNLSDIDFPGPSEGGGSMMSAAHIRTWNVSPPMTIADIPLSIITDSPLPDGEVGAAYSKSLTAMGGTAPYTWLQTGGSLPGGLWLDASGAISGTPSTDGTFNFTAQVTDSASGTATKDFSITITVLTPPEVTTNPATGMTKFRATLNGTLTGLGSTGGPVILSFEWGLTSSYGNTEIPFPSSWNGATPYDFSEQLTGLARDTTYHYRAKAEGPDGTTAHGVDQEFTTLP